DVLKHHKGTAADPEEEVRDVAVVSDIKQAFRAWDTDGNGCLSWEEFSEAASQLGMFPAAAKKLWRVMDKTADEEVDFEVMVNWFFAKDKDDADSLRAKTQIRGGAANVAMDNLVGGGGHSWGCH
ncbi:unnamed protein product, partial [Polarella glacialis]